MAKVVTQGKDEKAELIYKYLTGPLFRNRVSAIVEACVSMQDDLEAEKRALTKNWAKRERRLELLMGGTSGMWGDLQGLAGRSMPELHGLEVPQLGDSTDLDAAEGSEEDRG